MRVFRQSFWKANTSKNRIIPLLVTIIVGFPILFSNVNSVKSYLFLFLFIAIVIIMAFSQYFYVVLLDDKLMIKNGIYTFWGKEIYYKDIVKIRLMPGRGLAQPYMQVITEGQTGLAWQYVIDLVAETDYKNLIHELRTKGIDVETRGLDQWGK